ncbi:MAG: YbaN family protein [Stappiaceae bacterium]
MTRTFFALLGWVFVGIGFVGIFVPLLPTTIFFILAASCFARSSPKFETWILSHPRIGPPVRAWRDHGAISRSAKLLAVSGMLGGFMIFYFSATPSLALSVLVAAVLCACAIYVISRPTAA